MTLARFAGAAIGLVVVTAAGTALADPCGAPVGGFRPGAVVAGTIRYTGDGDGLCLGDSPDPATWVEIRLADFNAPELHAPGGMAAKVALDRYRGRRAVCVAQRGRDGGTRSYDRLIASCAIDGRSLAGLLTAAGVRQGGR